MGDLKVGQGCVVFLANKIRALATDNVIDCREYFEIKLFIFFSCISKAVLSFYQTIREKRLSDSIVKPF
jgi:hypothetical protein